MPVLPTGLPTLLDVMRRTDPNGAIASVVEAMTRESPFLQSALWKEGNLPTGHKVTTRNALPSLKWRKLNEGVPASKSTTVQTVETCGQLAGLSKVDVDAARLNGNEAAFRASEDSAFVSQFHNELEEAFFYSSSHTDPEQIHGLAPRFDNLSGDHKAQIVSSQISSSGGDQTSVWFVGWGDKKVYCVYPKGMPAGLQMVDMGRQLVQDSAGNEFAAWVTDWKWNAGLVVEDYRYVSAVRNIDTSTISKSGKLLIEDMVDAFHRIKSFGAGGGAIYCNRLVYTYLHLQAMDSVKNSTLTIEYLENGAPLTRFLGLPVYMTDGILNTEPIVS